MDEIYAYVRSSNQVNESQSTHLHRFRLMLGEDARSFRIKTKDGLLNSKNSNGPILTENYFGIDGQPIEFEWNISTGLSSLEIFQKSQKNLQDQNIENEHFEGRIIFMLIFNDIDWTKRGNSEIVFQIPTKSRITRRDSHEVIGHSSAQEMTTNGTQRTPTNLKEK